MTKQFFVKVMHEDPYLKAFNYTVSAGKIEVAIHRALVLFRKEQMKGRPIPEVYVKATAASNVKLTQKDG